VASSRSEKRSAAAASDSPEEDVNGMSKIFGAQGQFFLA
jgi:hypothetical protein